ncbi:MAG: 7,8-didemethyl-8-hydroxy-5-deazariboflavin synthase subunit CofG [Blastochloris sp.]|nr:7,8-didemethyl-8-hydroxy-5-deazariboflavin synthase subunit CofG [Blastochloris sp.]
MTPLAPPSRTGPLTYSRSVTLTLTHDCPWHCTYCGFRTDQEGLISESALDKLLAQAQTQGACEALLISGEAPSQLPHIRKELLERGFPDFHHFAFYVAERALQAGLLPHGNYGALTQRQLEFLRPVHVSMGVMLENVEDLPAIAPEKKSAGRLKTLEAAGLAKVPFTSGILIGLGESVASRFRSLDALAQSHQRHRQLQEILIQNYIPNDVSKPQLRPAPPTFSDYLDLIAHWRNICPDVPIQIPPNLNPYWKELLPYIDDLGGISSNRDEVNPLNPWAPIADYAFAAQQADRSLCERLAVYPSHTNAVWLDPALQEKVLLKKTETVAR